MQQLGIYMVRKSEQLKLALVTAVSTGPAAEPSGRFSPPLLAGGKGDGDPLCVLASRRWGPTYSLLYTHTGLLGRLL